MTNDRKVALDDYAIMPTKAHYNDAAYDLYSPGDFWLNPGGSVIIDTGVHLEVKQGEMGLVGPRSGLNFMHSVVASIGFVDTGYTGPIKVKLYNHSQKDQYRINRGERIAQITWLSIYTPEALRQVESLDWSERGDNGFGSSGK